MNRFKVSKFKNAFCVTPKRETWITDVRVGSPSSCGNHIKAGGAFMAYNADPPGGGSLGLLDVNSVGRQSHTAPLLRAHSTLVTDFDFSPFNDYLLATCSQDKTIKLWDLPEGGLTENVPSPVCTFQGGDRRVENVLFHPTASEILAASVSTTVKIFDLAQEQETLAIQVAKDQLQGISWKQDGSLLATTGKDKKLRIVDPRANSVVSEANGHHSLKDSRVQWLGQKDFIVSTGFNSNREREVKVWDARNFESACCSVAIGTSTGILIPLYDPDTGLLFLVGKGDQRIGVYEIPDGGTRVSEGPIYSSDLQQKGACIVPKRVVDVMSCEVQRVLQLTNKGIIPLKVEVPRTSHLNFFPELFPDTVEAEAALTSQQWLAGENAELAKISLDPAKRKNKGPKKPAIQKSASPKPANQQSASSKPANQTGAGDASSGQKQEVNHVAPAESKVETPPSKAPSAQTQVAKDSSSSSSSTPASSSMSSSSTPSSQSNAAANSSSSAAAAAAAADAPNDTSPKKKFTMSQTSKFRHLQGTLGQRNQHIFNIRNASINVFGECDGFHANRNWAAVPLGGSGGLITIIDVNKPGKLPETGVPTIQNGSALMDFVWDPFYDSRMAVACENAKILIWSFPEEGFEGTLTDPDMYLRGHEEKIYLIKFHPLASDVLLSASYDMTLKIWDLTTGQEKYSLTGHTDQIFSAAWSPDGTRIATVCKDNLIRVYEPRKANTPIAEGPGPQGARGARILWAHNGELLFTSGFERDSSRAAAVYDPSALSKPLETFVIDKSPATLIPCYDPDTHVVFMTGKGERLVTCLEILREAPYFLPLSSYSSADPHQALSFLPKTTCRVQDVEFMRALKLSKSTIEPVHFTLPRVKKEYFQDDVFPDTRVTWEPALTGSDWFSGKDGQLQTLSLCPEGMKHLSSIPKAGPAPKKYTSEQELSYKSDSQKRDEIMAAMTNKLALKSEPLPQDNFEGVDDDEWDD